MPSLFALLADPSVIVDGLDSVLGEVQNLLQGQIFGVKLPLLGDLLNDNPVSDLVGQIREPAPSAARQPPAGEQRRLRRAEGPDPVEALRRLRPGRARHPEEVRRHRRHAEPERHPHRASEERRSGERARRERRTSSTRSRSSSTSSSASHSRIRRRRSTSTSASRRSASRRASRRRSR